MDTLSSKYSPRHLSIESMVWTAAGQAFFKQSIFNPAAHALILSALSASPQDFFAGGFAPTLRFEICSQEMKDSPENEDEVEQERLFITARVLALTQQACHEGRTRKINA